MKRYGKKTLVKGMRIRYTSTHRIYDLAPEVIDTHHGNKIGYITYDLFMEMCRNKTLVKDFGDYWYAEYVVMC